MFLMTCKEDNKKETCVGRGGFSPAPFIYPAMPFIQ